MLAIDHRRRPRTATSRTRSRLRAEVRRHPRPGRARAGAALAARAGLVTPGQRKDLAIPRSGARAARTSASACGRRSCSTARSWRSTRGASRPGSSGCRAACTCWARATSTARRWPSVPPSSPSTCCATASTTCARCRLTDRRDASRAAVRHLGLLRGAPRRLHRGRRAAALSAGADAAGWEGLVSKRADSIYESGRRSPAWRKLKLPGEREFIVGGWTAPRASRQHFGALLLGAYEQAGRRRRWSTSVTSGPASPRRSWRACTRCSRRARRRSRRLARCPRPNERPHWVRPELVAQVRFTERTDEGLLRHPVYLGPARRRGRCGGDARGGRHRRARGAGCCQAASCPRGGRVRSGSTQGCAAEQPRGKPRGEQSAAQRRGSAGQLPRSMR